MTVQIYDNARHALGVATLDWSLQQMAAAIPFDGYVPVLGLHTYISAAQPFRSPSVPLGGQAVHPAGWWQCDPIGFSEAPIGSDMDCVVIFRLEDGMLVLAITFPAIRATKTTPVQLLYGLNDLGVCRP